MQIDQGSSRSAVVSDDVTDESVSHVDIRWSSEEDEVWKQNINLHQSVMHYVSIFETLWCLHLLL